MYKALPISVWFQCHSFSTLLQVKISTDSTLQRFDGGILLSSSLHFSAERESDEISYVSLLVAQDYIFYVCMFLQWVNSEVRQRPPYCHIQIPTFFLLFLLFYGFRAC
jgi:hypothetical protein